MAFNNVTNFLMYLIYVYFLLHFSGGVMEISVAVKVVSAEMNFYTHFGGGGIFKLSAESRSERKIYSVN